MISSMTGFAQGEADAPGGVVRWELRSVNHRYFDIQFRMPDEFRVLEGGLRGHASKVLARGKVEAQLRYLLTAGDARIEIDTDRLAALKDAVDRVERSWGALGTPDPLRVLAFPGVTRDPEPDLEALRGAAEQAFANAIEDLVLARQREGERLAEVLHDRCAALEEQVQLVEQRSPELRAQWIERLRNRCAELAVEVDAARLEQEVAVIAQRADVDEEMVRLRGHIEEVRDVLQRNEAIGRRLDFLMQELNREANTLSSKSQDVDLTRAAVEMKVVIEQMREQVQNVA